MKSDSKHILMTYLVVGIGRWDSALTESIGLVIEVSSISVPLILIAMSESLKAELWILLCPLIDMGKEMAKPFNGKKLERIGSSTDSIFFNPILFQMEKCHQGLQSFYYYYFWLHSSIHSFNFSLVA